MINHDWIDNNIAILLSVALDGISKDGRISDPNDIEFIMDEFKKLRLSIELLLKNVSNSIKSDEQFSMRGIELNRGDIVDGSLEKALMSVCKWVELKKNPDANVLFSIIKNQILPYVKILEESENEYLRRKLIEWNV